MHSLGIVQWDSNRQDHPGYPGRVSGWGPITLSQKSGLLKMPICLVTQVWPLESSSRLRATSQGLRKGQQAQSQ